MQYLYFTYPWLLWGLLALAIPIIIHLFNFRRYRRVFFSNTAFLQHLKKQTQSVSRLRHFLILLLRMIIVASLVLAFAQPIWGDKLRTSDVKTKKTVQLYIDNSFSMKAQVNQSTLLDNAIAQALSVAESFPDGYDFNLQTNDVYYKHLSMSRLMKRLQTIAFSPKSADGHKILQSVSADTTIAYSYLFSDFQKQSFPTDIYLKDSVSTVNLVLLSAHDVPNISVDSCFIRPTERATEFNLIYYVSNRSTQYISDVPVKLQINDSLKSVTTIALDSGETEIDTLSFSFAEDTVLRGQITIDDYPIVFDNTLNFVVHIPRRHRILLITNKDVPTYFTAGLNFPEFKIDSKTAGEITVSVLGDYDFVVLSGMQEITPTLTEVLEQYVSQGGRVLFVPDEIGNVDSYNLFFRSFRSVMFAESDTASLVVGTIEQQASLYKQVFDNIPANAQMPIVKSYFSIKNKGMGYVVLQAENGEPLVTETKHGQGRLYVFSLTASAENKPFYISPLFFPLLYNMATNNMINTTLYYTVGKPVDVVVFAKDNAQMVQVESLADSSRFIPYQRINATQRVVKLQQNQIVKAGFYALKQGQSIIDYCAFNTDRAESNMQFYTSEEITSFLEKNGLTNYTVVKNPTTTSITTFVKQQRHGQALWYWFVLLALVGLLAESLLLRKKDIKTKKAVK